VPVLAARDYVANKRLVNPGSVVSRMCGKRTVCVCEKERLIIESNRAVSETPPRAKETA
jgi:hypothetical protein